MYTISSSFHVSLHFEWAKCVWLGALHSKVGHPFERSHSLGSHSLNYETWISSKLLLRTLTISICEQVKWAFECLCPFFSLVRTICVRHLVAAFTTLLLLFAGHIFTFDFLSNYYFVFVHFRIKAIISSKPIQNEQRTRIKLWTTQWLKTKDTLRGWESNHLKLMRFKCAMCVNVYLKQTRYN